MNIYLLNISDKIQLRISDKNFRLKEELVHSENRHFEEGPLNLPTTIPTTISSNFPTADSGLEPVPEQGVDPVEQRAGGGFGQGQPRTVGDRGEGGPNGQPSYLDHYVSCGTRVGATPQYDEGAHQTQNHHRQAGICNGMGRGEILFSL